MTNIQRRVKSETDIIVRESFTKLYIYMLTSMEAP